jgi:DNA-binding MarR family transcriptional regulator
VTKTTSSSERDLSEIQISTNGADAALNVVRWLTVQKDDLASQWSTAIRLAQANGASLRDIAAAAGVAPQTVSNICRRLPS